MKGNQYNHKLPNIHGLKHHYFNENMSAEDIAKKYNVTRGAVFIKFRRYGIKIRTLSEAKKVAGYYANITPEFINFLNGLLLGDGCIVLTKEKKSGRYTHTDKHKSYLGWLKKYFLALRIECSEIRPQSNTTWQMGTKYYRNFVQIRNLWYPNGKKKIPYINLTPITLFNWYIGDGSYHKYTTRKSGGEKVVICSQFDQDGKAEMAKQLSKMGIKNSVYDNCLYIKAESRNYFFKYITNHNYPIPECYKYKF